MSEYDFCPNIRIPRNQKSLYVGRVKLGRSDPYVGRVKLGRSDPFSPEESKYIE
jgi:hypothetical protein